MVDQPLVEEMTAPARRRSCAKCNPPNDACNTKPSLPLTISTHWRPCSRLPPSQQPLLKFAHLKTLVAAFLAPSPPASAQATPMCCCCCLCWCCEYFLSYTIGTLSTQVPHACNTTPVLCRPTCLDCLRCNHGACVLLCGLLRSLCHGVCSKKPSAVQAKTHLPRCI